MMKPHIVHHGEQLIVQGQCLRNELRNTGSQWLVVIHFLPRPHSQSPYPPLWSGIVIALTVLVSRRCALDMVSD